MGCFSCSNVSTRGDEVVEVRRTEGPGMDMRKHTKDPVAKLQQELLVADAAAAAIEASTRSPRRQQKQKKPMPPTLSISRSHGESSQSTSDDNCPTPDSPGGGLPSLSPSTTAATTPSQRRSSSRRRSCTAVTKVEEDPDYLRVDIRQSGSAVTAMDFFHPFVSQRSTPHLRRRWPEGFEGQSPPRSPRILPRLLQLIGAESMSPSKAKAAWSPSDNNGMSHSPKSKGGATTPKGARKAALSEAQCESHREQKLRLTLESAWDAKKGATKKPSQKHNSKRHGQMSIHSPTSENAAETETLAKSLTLPEQTESLKVVPLQAQVGYHPTRQYRKCMSGKDLMVRPSSPMAPLRLPRKKTPLAGRRTSTSEYDADSPSFAEKKTLRITQQLINPNEVEHSSTNRNPLPEHAKSVSASDKVSDWLSSSLDFSASRSDDITKSSVHIRSGPLQPTLRLVRTVS